jgi:RNA polymerase sigma factor (sigma-70 family)
LEWPEDAFEEHLAGELPEYPEDLYLAGAAGWRVDEAWVVIEEELGPHARRTLAKQPHADYLIEDLWGDTLQKLMEDDPKGEPIDKVRYTARILRYRGKTKLVNYFILTGKRIAIDRQRRRRGDVSLDGIDSDGEGYPAHEPVARPEVSGLEERETLGKLTTAISQAFSSLSPEQQFLLAGVYRDGIQQKEAAELLGWSPFKASRQMKSAIESLREAAESIIEGHWTPGVAAAWETCWQNCWESVQVGQDPASESASGGQE